MRDIPVGLLAHIQSSTITPSLLMKIERTDGNLYTYTSTPVDVVYAGHTYLTVDGIDSSTLDTASGTGIDNLDITGLLSAVGISNRDIRAGLLDGATVSLYLVSYEDTTLGSVELLGGWSGDLTLTDGTYVIAFRSLSQSLAVQVGDLTQPTCRRKQFGDFGCRAQVTINSTTITNIVDSNTLVCSGDAEPSGFYNNGLVTFTGGQNNGISREIKVQTSGGHITLQEPFPFLITVGDPVDLREGCDRLFTTCITKRAPVSDGGGVSNHLNFDGEDLLPGNDQYRQIGRAQ